MTRRIDGRDGAVYSSRVEWGHYSKGHQVRVLPPHDPYAGRVGTVQSTFLDGGEMVHVVEFIGQPGDNPPLPYLTAYYLAEELRSAAVGTGAKPQPRQQES
jgi:hypothetical protein